MAPLSIVPAGRRAIGYGRQDRYSELAGGGQPGRSFQLTGAHHREGAAMEGSTPDPGEKRAAELQTAQRALARRIEGHHGRAGVARPGTAPDGSARAVHELTGRPAAVEDRSGHLRAWAGPGRP